MYWKPPFILCQKVNSGFDFFTEISDHHLSPVAPAYISVIQGVFKMTSIFTKFK